MHLLDGCEIVANVFDGGPKTTVTCEMNRTRKEREADIAEVGQDPLVQEALPDTLASTQMVYGT